MQALAWLGFAFGMTLLLLTGSSVIKTLPDPAGWPQDTDTPLRMPG